jgi:hypothetical protein
MAPEVSLDWMIESAINQFELDIEAASEDRDKEVVNFVNQLAKWLLQGADNLVWPEDKPWPNVEPRVALLLARHEAITSDIHDRIQVDAAWKFSIYTQEMADRCLELADLVLETKPNESVLKFLRRLSRAYIAGLVSESIILCRAVLENAVVERFERSGIPLPATPEGKSTMTSRLATALSFGWLSDDAWAAAKEIWIRGNTAVHKDPDVATQALDTVKKTMLVLSQLYPKKRAAP